MAETKMISVKLLVDAKGKRVLYAEAGKDFVDFLFHLLSLPVGTVIKILTQKDMVPVMGCLGDLHKSVQSLSPDYLLETFDKDLVLKPTSSFCVTSLSLNVEPPTRNFYHCVYCTNSYYTDSKGTVTCPFCKKYTMSGEMMYVCPKSSVVITSSSSKLVSGGCVKGEVSYMVLDNLEVKPLSTSFIITLLNKFNVKMLIPWSRKRFKLVSLRE